MTELDFANKVAWEGGVMAALEYGLSADDITEEGELKKAWRAFEESFKHVNGPLAWVEEIVDEILDGNEAA